MIDVSCRIACICRVKCEDFVEVVQVMPAALYSNVSDQKFLCEIRGDAVGGFGTHSRDSTVGWAMISPTYSVAPQGQLSSRVTSDARRTDHQFTSHRWFKKERAESPRRLTNLDPLPVTPLQGNIATGMFVNITSTALTA